MIQVNRIYLIFNRLVTKKFLVDTSEVTFLMQRGLAKILYLFGTDKESVKITTF